jgi:hypothetical protein
MKVKLRGCGTLSGQFNGGGAARPRKATSIVVFTRTAVRRHAMIAWTWF